jgi:hypothetical protein
VTFAHVRSRRTFHGSTLIVVASLTALIAGGAEGNGITKSVTQTCTGGGQLCNNVATVPISLPNGGPGIAQFTPGQFTCSNFRIHYLVDGTEVNVTAFVGPGGNTGIVSLGPIGPGAHTIGLKAEGQTGGCNGGTLQSWAGVVHMQKGP